MPVLVLGILHGPPPVPDPFAAVGAAVVLVASFCYAAVLQRHRPPASGAWAVSVFLARTASFWFAAAAPLLFVGIGLLAFLGGLVVLVIGYLAFGAVAAAGMFGTSLLRAGRWQGLLLKVVSLAPFALWAFVPMTPDPPPPHATGKVLGDSYVTMGGWLALDIAVLLTIAALRARHAPGGRSCDGGAGAGGNPGEAESTVGAGRNRR